MMVRRWLLVTSLIMVLLAALPAAQPVAADPDLPTVSAANHPGAEPLGDFMGMVVRDPHYEWDTNPDFPQAVNKVFIDTMLANLKQIGVRWIRFELRAEEGLAYDPANPESGLRLEQYDYFVERANEEGFKLIGLLASNLVRNPNYIRVEEIERIGPAYEVPNCDDYKYGCGTNPYMRVWLDRAFAIAKRYENKIAAYEVMNEENRYLIGDDKDPDFGRGVGISPLQMARLMTKFYRVFKNRGGPERDFGVWRHDVRLILGGLHPDRCADCVKEDGSVGMTDREYLNAIYNVKAAASDKKSIFKTYLEAYGTYPMDGVGYHPYVAEMRSGLVPEHTGFFDLFRLPTRIDELRNVMLQNEDIRNRIWVTEVGDRGAPALGDPATSPSLENELRQAEVMRTVYRVLWNRREFIENVLWFKYEDFAVPCDPTAVGPENWGVVRIKPDRTNCNGSEGVTHDYDDTGEVERFKESYLGYKAIAEYGFSYHLVYLPQVHR